MTRPCGFRDSREARRLLERVIAARQAYADHLRALANGQAPDDPELRGRLKEECEETLQAWKSVQEHWRYPAAPREALPEILPYH